MSSVQYYLLPTYGNDIVALLLLLEKSNSSIYVTVSRVEGERPPALKDTPWVPEIRYLVRLTAEQIADLTVHDAYKDWLADSRACSIGAGWARTQDGKFRAETKFTVKPMHV